MLNFGIALSIIGVLTAIAGLITVLLSSFNKNKVQAMRGAYVMATGGVILLISFTFCSVAL